MHTDKTILFQVRVANSKGKLASLSRKCRSGKMPLICHLPNMDLRQEVSHMLRTIGQEYPLGS